MKLTLSHLLWTCSAVLAVLAGFSVWRLAGRQAELENAAADTRRCAQLAADIQALRELPQFAVLEAESDETTATRIEEAARAAALPGHKPGLPGRAITLIQPQSPQRLSDSPYQVRPYRIDLVGVTLEQLVVFAHHLADESRGMTVRDLRMRDASVDSDQRGRELWDVELTLTQLIFSPNSRPSVSSTHHAPRFQRKSFHDESGIRPTVAAVIAGSRLDRRL